MILIDSDGIMQKAEMEIVAGSKWLQIAIERGDEELLKIGEEWVARGLGRRDLIMILKKEQEVLCTSNHLTSKEVVTK